MLSQKRVNGRHHHVETQTVAAKTTATATSATDISRSTSSSQYHRALSSQHHEMHVSIDQSTRRPRRPPPPRVHDLDQTPDSPPPPYNTQKLAKHVRNPSTNPRTSLTPRLPIAQTHKSNRPHAPLDHHLAPPRLRRRFGHRNPYTPHVAPLPRAHCA